LCETAWLLVAQVSLPSSIITVATTVNPVTAPPAFTDGDVATGSIDANAAAATRAVILFTVPPRQDGARSDQPDRNAPVAEPG
jgi:hypothetical protein